MNGMFKSCFGGFLRRKQATLLFCRSASLEATSERGRAESTPDGFRHQQRGTFFCSFSSDVMTFGPVVDLSSEISAFAVQANRS